MSEWPNALAGVCGRWRAARAEERLCSGSEARYSQMFSAFCRYAEANGVGSPRGATADLCRRFIDAPLRGDRRPCTATSCLRLTVLRSAFEVMVSSGDVTANPTIALRVRHETPLRVPAALTPPRRPHDSQWQSVSLPAQHLGLRHVPWRFLVRRMPR